MQNYHKKSNHIYDYVIIGSGLVGLVVANALNKLSQNILLIESSDNYGGVNRSINTPFGAVNNGLRFLPDSPQAHQALAFLEMLLATSVQPESYEEPAVSYEAGGLRPFVGFGNNPPPFYEEISYFANARGLNTKLDAHEWTQILFNNYNGDFLPRSYVTKFHMPAEGGKSISHLTINGQKNINAKKFIYCADIKQLKTLLPEAALGHKAFLKITKNQYWTAVCLDLLHAKFVTDSKAMHILNGTTQDEFGPCAGKFLAAGEVGGEQLQYSQWMTFIDDEEAEDSEIVGLALKKIKRQIKRAYPEALEQLKFERILVVPSYSGNGELKLTDEQALPNCENFHIASHQVHTQKNLIGALLQAEAVVEALGAHPMKMSPANLDTEIDLQSLSPDA